MALFILKVYQRVHNIHLEGTMSRNFKMALVIFYVKKREDFNYFFIIIFLDFIK